MAKTPSAHDRIALLERMLRIRRFEEEVLRVAQAHPYVGRQHLYIGHEPSAASVALALTDKDRLHTTHRNHGFLIARGADPGKALAEIMGRAGGLNAGQGGPWHLCDASVGIPSTSAMVGGSVGLAVGTGLGLKTLKTGGIAVAHFGDGTLDEGICYEALNLAAILDLPVLFLCENNAKEGQRPSSMLAAGALRDVPAALRIPSEAIDGRDVDATAEAAKTAADTVRRTGKPVFLQVNFERWPGSHQLRPEFPTGVTDLSHAWEEDRIGGDHADWTRDYDALRLYVKALTGDGTMTRDDVLELDATIRGEMEKARAFAEASPYPEAAVLSAVDGGAE